MNIVYKYRLRIYCLDCGHESEEISFYKDSPQWALITRFCTKCQANTGHRIAEAHKEEMYLGSEYDWVS